MKKILILSVIVLMGVVFALSPVYTQTPTESGRNVGVQFFSVKRDNIGTGASVNINFGFKSRKILLIFPTSNNNEVCVDFAGGTAVCPAANTAGNARFPQGTQVLFDDFSTSSISVISSAGTQIIYVTAWR